MSRVNFKETLNSDWKVLLTAIERANSEGLRNRSRHRPKLSYEEFVKNAEAAKRRKQEQQLQIVANSLASDLEATITDDTDDFALGEWNSENDDFEISDDDSGQEHIGLNNRNKKWTKFKRKENCEDDTGSGSSFNDSLKEEYSEDPYHRDESSWESISGESDNEKSFDEFLQESRAKSCPEQDSKKYLPYTSLTDFLVENYYAHVPNNCETKTKGCSHKVKFQGPELSLDERLPMMEIVDALQEMNRVLQAGKITPRMERVLEYKQDYPFTEGYHEEPLGWCPWLVYKLERLCKRISAKQWPY